MGNQEGDRAHLLTSVYAGNECVLLSQEFIKDDEPVKVPDVPNRDLDDDLFLLFVLESLASTAPKCVAVTHLYCVCLMHGDPFAMKLSNQIQQLVPCGEVFI